MPLYLDTRGRSTLGIGICARCSCRFSLEDLHPDPNSPGLRVCIDDLDAFDPWRLPARQLEKIPNDYPRPDTPLYPLGPSPIYANQYDGVTQILPTHPWQPLTPYGKGASINPVDVNLETTTLPQPEFVCIVAGISAASPPTWPPGASATVTDGTVTWFNAGIELIVG